MSKYIDILEQQAANNQPYIFAILPKNATNDKKSEILDYCKLHGNMNYIYKISGEIILGQLKEEI